jgi:hypothetical protein
VKELLKDKRILIAGVVLILIVAGIGIFLFFNSTSTKQAQNVNETPTQTPQIPTISADSIGLTLKPGIGGKTVLVSISNTNGIKAIDYELSYISKGNIPRGAIGSFDLTKKTVSKEIILGTCSDVCHYDTDISNIKIILKITKNDGKVYQSQAFLSSVSQ